MVETFFIKRSNNDVVLLNRISYNKNLSCLNFYFTNKYNVGSCEILLESIYSNLLIDEEYIHAGNHKVLMLIANYKGVEFTYHHNVLVNNRTTFKEYYAAVKDNISKLYSEGYEIHNVSSFMMRV